MTHIDWKTGTYRAQNVQGNGNDFRVTLASDWGALWDYEQIMQDAPLAVYGDLLPFFRSSDLNIVNVECAVDSVGSPIPKGGPNLRSAAGTLSCLTEVPFHIACLANNHSMDFGPESLQETIAELNRVGIDTVGAGMDGTEAARPQIVKTDEATIGIINCAEGEACVSIAGGPGAHPFDVPALTAQVRELKKQVDIVIVIFHGGREFAPVPPPYVVDGLRQIAEAGASAIVGHHPHVPQGIEIHHDTPIVYSQGNFVFRWAERDKDLYAYNTGYLVHLDFCGKQLTKLSLTPYRTTLQGIFALTKEEKAQLFQELEELSAPLANPVALQHVWDAFVDIHGTDTLIETLQSLIDIVPTNPTRAAAVFHNLFYSPAHREFYLNGMRRLSRGELGDSPQWAKYMVRDWNERRLQHCTCNNCSETGEQFGTRGKCIVSAVQ